MKKTMILAAMAMLAMTAGAKSGNDTLYVTTTPQMHCANCEAKIKGNLRFEKGVKDILTDIPAQKVTVVFNPKKTDRQRLIASFSKFGYTAREVKKDEQVQAQADMGSCENM